ARARTRAEDLDGKAMISADGGSSRVMGSSSKAKGRALRFLLARTIKMRRQNSLENTAMSLNIRRVVTGHDGDGKAIVRIDEICKNVRSGRERHHSCVVWSTGESPADISADADGASRPIGSTDPG